MFRKGIGDAFDYYFYSTTIAFYYYIIYHTTIFPYSTYYVLRRSDIKLPGEEGKYESRNRDDVMDWNVRIDLHHMIADFSFSTNKLNSVQNR